ncbi:MAG: DNA repair protein RecO C-terminal domain-containing protein [Fluviicoccus sp.]|uniref:DNA repair protein RecO n=1 Tax=Fluviicoccus sp. TaxID=2003552 RepID=UPI00271A1598|nr:DNA repair protein RecO C-terminal domain-containing protein [Fluviicoccus sp.]MDO8329368.1 DNA repair protein RecO C-terminal domain-containing protein [Fluviicoccus sp.]
MTAGGEFCHAFLLHTRPYKERSRLVDLWTLEQGRVSAVGRASVPLFQPCLVRWRGRSTLKTMTHCEQAGLPLSLHGEALFAGFYLNELLVRLLPPDEAHPTLFANYSGLLGTLGVRATLEPGLREFEKQLLAAMGYGITFDQDDDGHPLQAGQYYRFEPGTGMVACAEGWTADILQAIAVADYARDETRMAARQIMRRALAEHLGDKPLKSRELWMRTKNEHSAGR